MNLDLSRRESALIEGLQKNEAETSRWETIKEENKQASENIDKFVKKLNVEVLVPIAGNKAFMPGFLYHTNEILVGHNKGMYSMCSTAKAQEILKYRLKLVKDRLESLRKEREMFQNKLEVPYTDGVLPNENQQEIIEEYDEEIEKIWREEHKKRVREYKMKEKEKEEIEKNEKTHEEVIEMLDQLELIEELDEELEDLEIDDNETLQKLMSGEIKLPPEKRRISYAESNSNSNIVVGNTNNEKDDNNEKREEIESNIDTSMKELYKKYKSDKLPETQLENNFTNNNTIPNSEDFRQHRVDDNDDNSDDSDNSFDEFDEIEKEMKNMSVHEKIQHLKISAKATEKALRLLTINNIEDYNSKLYLLELLDYINDRIEILKDERDNYDKNNAKITQETISDENDDKKLKKKISFAMEDEIQFIDENEKVENMMKSNKNNRDIIVLDSDVYQNQKENSKKSEEKEQRITDVNNKKESILDKVEKSCNFVSENQCQQDFDLVSKILNSDSTSVKTALIKFDHSEKKFDNKSNENNENIIDSPADIYRIYSGYFSNSTVQEVNRLDNVSKVNKVEQESSTLTFNQDKINKEIKAKNNSIDAQNEKMAVQTPIAKKEKTNDENILEEQKNVMSNTQNKDEQEKCQQPTNKSILKNKNAVKLEIHRDEEIQSKKECTMKIVKENHTCYESIVGEVVENPSKEPVPDPLPEGNFVDSHAPKKRISRFKQMRDNSVRAKS